LLNLIGTYECKADAKGRIMVPATLKKQLLSIAGGGFVLKRSVFQPCLELHPMGEWNKLMEKIGKLNRFNRQNNEFIRTFTAGVRMVDLDTTGRLNIPKELMTYASLSRELVVCSTINIVEIWDKQQYEQSVNAASDDFADLAEQVMGGVSDADEVS